MLLEFNGKRCSFYLKITGASFLKNQIDLFLGDGNRVSLIMIAYAEKLTGSEVDRLMTIVYRAIVASLNSASKLNLNDRLFLDYDESELENVMTHLLLVTDF